MPHVERALELAERLRLADVVVEALINKALILPRRPNESLGLMRQALVLAEETGADRGAIRACMNLSYLLSLAGRNEEAVEAVEHGIALARRRGDRVRERALTTNLMGTYFTTGRWDDAQRVVDEIPEEGRVAGDPVQASAMLDLAQMRSTEVRPSACASSPASSRDGGTRRTSRSGASASGRASSSRRPRADMPTRSPHAWRRWATGNA